ncbi:MAG: SpoIID/LytB domain-containing protein [Bdellovibrionales bacterium]|nr:SpoIID/LytB domain-containing protein [Bdellovibrionales bacterium]
MKRRSRWTVGLLVGIFSIAGCVPPRVTTPSTPTKPLAIENKPVAKPVQTVRPKLSEKDKVLIGIRVEVKETNISSVADMQVTDLTSNKKQTWTAGQYHVTAANGELVVEGKPVGAKVRLRSVNPSIQFKCGNNEYRGELIVRVVGAEKLTVIDELSIDDYLKGVLPREASVSWPDHALRVQAVASRTYLASHLGSHLSQGFDLCSDVHCQVYGGMTKEHPKTNDAVDATHDEILIYDGKPISAFFHSNCGGSTEEVQYVWGTAAKPYLPRKKCSYGTADPRYEWTYTISFSEMLALLKKSTKVQGKKLESFRVRHKSPSGRAETIAVRTDADVYELSGNAFRIALDPEKIRSTLFTDVVRQGHSYTFRGRGWGHGVGMCQWGAKGQAEAGRDYREILDFYYPNTKLVMWSR